MGSPELAPEQLAKEPLTDRGRRTRARLVSAARQVFEDLGFLDARITDIAEAARVAHGTFYTYFSTKEDVFREVALAVQREQLAPRPGEGDGVAGEGDELAGDGASWRDGDAERPALSIVERIDAANRRYLESYMRNARIMAVIEQVATFNSELLEIRRQVRTEYVARSTRSIARWQAAGIADPELDAAYAASALGSMVDRFAYVWLVLGGDFELEKSVQQLTRLWVQALALTPAAWAR